MKLNNFCKFLETMTFIPLHLLQNQSINLSPLKSMALTYGLRNQRVGFCPYLNTDRPSRVVWSHLCCDPVHSHKQSEAGRLLALQSSKELCTAALLKPCAGAASQLLEAPPYRTQTLPTKAVNQGFVARLYKNVLFGNGCKDDKSFPPLYTFSSISPVLILLPWFVKNF